MTCWQDSTRLSRGAQRGSKPEVGRAKHEWSDFEQRTLVGGDTTKDESVYDVAKTYGSSLQEKREVGDKSNCKGENLIEEQTSVEDWHDFKHEPLQTDSCVEQRNTNLIFKYCFQAVRTCQTDVSVSHCIFCDNR